MELDNFSGVTDSSPKSGSSTTAVSPTEMANNDSGGSVSDASTNMNAAETASAEPAPDAILNEIDPAALSEKASKAFAFLRTQNQDLSAFRSEWEPISQWVTQHGGHERLAADVEFINSIFTEPPDRNVDPQGFDAHRNAVHTAFYNQSPQAYLQLAEDFRSDPSMRDYWMEQEGVTPDLLDLARQLRDNPDLQSQLSTVDPDMLASIPEHLRETFRALPLAVQQDLANRSDDVRAFDLQNYADAQAVKRQQEADRQAQAARAEEARQQAAAQRQNKVYSDVRTIIGQKVAKYFPNDKDAQGDLVNAIEAAFLSDPRGASLWQQFSGWAEKGEMRRVSDNLLSLVTELEVIAQPRIQRQLDLAEKARKWDEYQLSIAPNHTEPQLHGDTPSQNGYNKAPAQGDFEARIAEYARRAYGNNR